MAIAFGGTHETPPRWTSPSLREDAATTLHGNTIEALLALWREGYPQLPDMSDIEAADGVAELVLYELIPHQR